MNKLDKLYLDNTLRKAKLENSIRSLKQVSERAIKKYKYDEAELDANIAKVYLKWKIQLNFYY